MDFVLLPDTEAGEHVARLLNLKPGHRRVAHASGRPWIVGSWADDELLEAVSDRGVRLVVLGFTRVTAGRLDDLLRPVARLDDLDRVATRLPGSWFLFGSANGDVRAQGSVSGVHRLYHAEMAGVTVVANGPLALAELTGAGLDVVHVARHLLSPSPPWPLSEQSDWQGVEPVATDHYLELRRDSGARVVRWWRPPDPDTPVADAATVRDALTEAVALRTARGGTLSADLSGGMDSTSLCFLAASGPAELVTMRWGGRDLANDDAAWSARAAAKLPRARHVVIPPSEVPLNFAGLTTDRTDPEAPFAWIRGRAIMGLQARRLAELGSTVHLTGHGGDELFYALPMYDHTVIRQQPVRYLQTLRMHQALRRWSVPKTLRQLWDNRSYGRWLADAGRALGAPPTRQAIPCSDWGVAITLPPWATPDAVTTMRDALLGSAHTCAPLHPLRGQHVVLQTVRECGASIRQVNRLTSAHGVSWHAPYLDDRVVEAVLAVRIADRAEPRSYKAVLGAAMRGIVPPELLGRPSKAEYSADVYAGLKRHRPELLELCDGMRLAELGLVDAGMFRSAVLGLHPTSRTLIPLFRTLACETWLRSISASALGLAATPSTA
ncbi:asparagine synthase-related protein [Cryptosporangium aurantiacum]|uniref:asparagine synthase (glutamine-hydrolyzing) n=1 Tax=Cryptosporangium aurantiacum TaxID=134849 RepID=A0A1M7RP80_9ACTN|nr:asparagine synthase-related protein [Cryptosporangium aurantiacum]SHN47902.1 asparagine synthase (glutamine-hydrolysing) [Cryptosporangium aurantiacum]